MREQKRPLRAAQNCDTRIAPSRDRFEPEYEVAFRLYANGITTDFEIDYGNFALSGTLERLEAVPRTC